MKIESMCFESVWFDSTRIVSNPSAQGNFVSIKVPCLRIDHWTITSNRSTRSSFTSIDSKPCYVNRFEWQLSESIRGRERQCPSKALLLQDNALGRYDSKRFISQNHRIDPFQISQLFKIFRRKDRIDAKKFQFHHSQLESIPWLPDLIWLRVEAWKSSTASWKVRLIWLWEIDSKKQLKQ